MTVVQLASLDDVKAAIGRELTPSEGERVGAILDKASELFRREARQQFTPGESTVRVKVNGGRVYLRERPVIEVSRVVDDTGSPVPFARQGQWLTVSMLSHQFVTVTYAHGDDEVPELVRLTIADVARQVLMVPKAAQEGVTQQTRTEGPYTLTQAYATWSQGGAARLAPDDVAVAQSFRVRVPTVWVQ